MRLRRRQAATAIPTTSMGDIAFLLTTFFILVSVFARDVSVKVNLPESDELRETPTSISTVTIDQSGRIHLDGSEVGSVADVEAELTERLRDQTDEAGRRVRFRCDRDIARSEFEPVLEAIAKAGGIVIAVGEQARRPQ